MAPSHNWSGEWQKDTQLSDDGFEVAYRECKDCDARIHLTRGVGGIRTLVFVPGCSS